MGRVFVFVLFCSVCFAQATDQWIEILTSRVNTTRIRDNFNAIVKDPHVMGTPQSRQVAEFIKKSFEESGAFDEVKIDEHSGMIAHYPVSRSVTVLSPKPYTAELNEPPSLDPSTSSSDVIHPWIAYGPSGDVTGDVLYVNYGRLKDWDFLSSQGLSGAGKICIARYGQLYRGVIALLAEENGCSGLLIYSDPRDDGFDIDDPFPVGAARPDVGAQRGTLLYPYCEGNPTPERMAGVCGLPKGKKLYPEKMPVQPLSWKDAQPIMEQLQNAKSYPMPLDWQGGLAFRYHIGPGPARVNMNLVMNFTTTSVYNVIASIHGSTEPDKVVMMSNHHDAWTFGGVDPSSGTVTMLEAANLFGEMRRQGWKPRRTIRFGEWDGEEYGLLGSAAYSEANADDVVQNYVALLNVDSAMNGLRPSLSRLQAGLSPLLSNLLVRAMTVVPSPLNASLSILDAHVQPVELSPLGSGSDHATFAFRYGVPSINMIWSSSAEEGLYHSRYEGITLYEKIVDPGYVMTKSMTSLVAVMCHFAATDVVIDYDVENFAQSLSGYIKIYQQQNPSSFVDFSSYVNAADQLAVMAARVASAKVASSLKDINAVNSALLNFPRVFLAQGGIPDRPFFRDILIAPDLFNGYSAEVLPTVTGSDAARQYALDGVAGVIQQAAKSLDVIPAQVPFPLPGIIVLAILGAGTIGIVIFLVVRYRKKKKSGYSQIPGDE